MMLMARWVEEWGGGQGADIGSDSRDPEKGTMRVEMQAEVRGTVKTCLGEVRDGEGWQVEGRK